MKFANWLISLKILRENPEGSAARSPGCHSVLLIQTRFMTEYLEEPMAGWRVIPDSRAGTPPGYGIPPELFPSSR